MPGYIAPRCPNKAKCMICTDLGLDGEHRMGSIRCNGITTPPSRILNSNNKQNDVQTNGSVTKDKSQVLNKKLESQKSTPIQSTPEERKTSEGRTDEPEIMEAQ